MKWLIVHTSRDDCIGTYRCFYVNRGYYSSDKSRAKRFSWVGALMELKRLKRGHSGVYEDKYFAVKDV